jgi:hypothetical protein
MTTHPSSSPAVERLSRDEFDRLSPDKQSDHVQESLTALRQSIPHDAAAVGPFIDARLYVQELLEWAPAEVERLWPMHRSQIESNAGEINAAFREALAGDALNPAHAQFARDALQASERLLDPADEYI